MDFNPGFPSRFTVLILCALTLTTLYLMIVRVVEQAGRPPEVYLLCLLSGWLVLGILWLAR